jgi:Cytochrome c
MAYHWDGLNTDLTEVVRSSALGDGTAPKDLPVSDLQKLQDWLLDLKPPPYPAERFPVDTALATAGKALFHQQCASCHAFEGARTGQVIPLEEVGTDPHRLAIWRKDAADAYNAYGKDYAWRFSHFRSTNGYVSPPLDAIWTRAPYLHNGSVPTLRDLLEPPDARPKTFYRGYNVFDPKNVGFIARGEDAQHAGSRYDTSVPGNSNAGHVWGTTLSGAEKEQLIEFLKTQ